MQIYSNICNAMLSYFFGSAKHHKVFSQFINMENSLQVLATLKRKRYVKCHLDGGGHGLTHVVKIFELFFRSPADRADRTSRYGVTRVP